MSLLGRLEDLSLADIVQIVFLSRRTGVLEILDATGRFTVLFRHGLIVNASSPLSPDLISHLEASGTIDAAAADRLRLDREAGKVPGSILVESGVVTADALGELIRQRVIDVVTPLLESREGEFNFILSESIDRVETEYDVEAVFKEGGIAPQKIFGEGEKLKPLRGLEESLKAGKSLLRSSTPMASDEETEAAIEGSAALREIRETPVAPVQERAVQEPAVQERGTVLPFPSAELPDPEEPSESAANDALVFDELDQQEDAPVFISQPEVLAGARTEPESLADFTYREQSPAKPAPDSLIVVLFERDPLLRVATRRAFAKKGVAIMQFGSFDDTCVAIRSLLDGNQSFLTFLGLDHERTAMLEDALDLVRLLKGRTMRLPIMVIDTDADFRRRHQLIQEGVDMYITRPSPAHLKPLVAQEQLTLFADELVLFSQRAFNEPGEQAESGGSASTNPDRSFSLLRRLIQELSSHEDISQLALTMLRLASEYFSRVALFRVTPTHYVGVSGFMAAADAAFDARVRTLRISKDEPSVFSEVEKEGRPHRGKLRRDRLNVEMLERLGGALPNEVGVFPILHQDKCLGLLYGDNSGTRTSIGDTAGLEIFLSQAGFAFDNALFASQQGSPSSKPPLADDV